LSAILDLEAFDRALAHALPARPGPTGLHEPQFRGREWEYVKHCLDSTWVSSLGPYVDRFEAALAEYTGAAAVVPVMNGTAALHASLMLVGVRHDDEVLVPTLTFVATANAVAHCGAVPHFVDSEERTFGIDPARLRGYLRDIAAPAPDGCANRRTGRSIRALVAMHVFGHPCDLDPLRDICAEFRLELVEDAAESLGSHYKGRHTGTIGRLAALSFNGNKIVTTGGGGAILTNDAELGRRAKHLTSTARVPHKWSFIHDEAGYNYRMPNLNAALGCAQLEELPRFLAAKRALAERYRAAFAGVAGLRVHWEPEFGRSNFWLNTLVLDESSSGLRDEILERTTRRGWQARPAWTLMHHLPMYRDCPKMDTPVAESLERRIINLPSSAALGDADGR
jgi:perosamine synthetase